MFFLEVSDPNHTDTHEDCHAGIPVSPWIMYEFSEFGFHRAHLLNMDEQYLGGRGTEYQVHETVAEGWSNNRQADLSDPNLPPDLFLTLAFLQRSSLGDNIVMQCPMDLFLCRTHSPRCRRFSACRFSPC